MTLWSPSPRRCDPPKASLPPGGGGNPLGAALVVTYRAAHFSSPDQHIRTAQKLPPQSRTSSQAPSLGRLGLRLRLFSTTSDNFVVPLPQTLRSSRGDSSAGGAQESLRDGPLDDQFIPDISGRPGSGVPLAEETPDAQHVPTARSASLAHSPKVPAARSAQACPSPGRKPRRNDRSRR